MALGEKDPEHSLLLRLAEVGAEQEEGEDGGEDPNPPTPPTPGEDTDAIKVSSETP